MAALTTGKILEYGNVYYASFLCPALRYRAVRTMGRYGGAGLGWGGNLKEEGMELFLQDGPGVERIRASRLGLC